MDSSAGESNPLNDRVKRGDEQALAEFFSQQRARLWRMVNFRLDRRLYGRVDPDDVLQEGYLDAVRRIRHYNGDSCTELFIWLRMIVTQTMIDTHRRHLGAAKRDPKREVRIHGIHYPQATSVSLSVQLFAHLTSPSQAAMRAELSDQLERVLEGMDPIDREVLALRHFEELTNSEVARVLGIEQKAASMRYVRAIRRLKGILTEIPGFLGEDQNGS